MDKTKIDETKAKLKDVQDAVLPKVKSALSEIKTNFRADEGTTGFPKIKSMFVNLWKSGTVGKAALIAAAVIILLLPWVFGGSKVSKLIQLKREVEEFAVQICELNDLLEKDDELELFDGRSLEDEEDEKDLEKFRTMTSEQLNMALTMGEGLHKNLKEKLEEKKAECKKKGIEIENDSPLRVAKKFLLCVRAKDVQGMKNLMTGGSDAEKESMAKKILDFDVYVRGGNKKLDQLKRVGRVYFNGRHSRAGVALEDDRLGTAPKLGNGAIECQCLDVVKTDDGWLIDAKEPICGTSKILYLLR